MKFIPQGIEGLAQIRSEPSHDERGYFARVFSDSSYLSAGFGFHVRETNLSYNAGKYTLRGLHFQADSPDDAKLVKCLRGSVYDVVVDLRSESPSYLQWTAVELAESDVSCLLIPAGCAHGFMTLEEHSTLLYLMGTEHVPELARGYRW